MARNLRKELSNALLRDDRRTVIHLSTVDLEVAAGRGQFEALVLRRVEELEDVLGGQSVDPVLRVLQLKAALIILKLLKSLKPFLARLGRKKWS